jgi:Tfp pilus assembly protein FimT
MMIRTVLAVALAAALVAVSQPAIQQAGRERTATTVADEVDRFVERAEHLIDTDDATARPGARRIVTIDLPEDGRVAAGVDRLSFEPRLDGDDRTDATATSAITWVIDGGDRHERVLERVRLETTDGSPLRLSEPGQHRLVLSLRGSSANPSVHVQRFEPGGDDGA